MMKKRRVEKLLVEHLALLSQGNRFHQEQEIGAVQALAQVLTGEAIHVESSVRPILVACGIPHQIGDGSFSIDEEWLQSHGIR